MAYFILLTNSLPLSAEKLANTDRIINGSNSNLLFIRIQPQQASVMSNNGINPHTRSTPVQKTEENSNTHKMSGKEGNGRKATDTDKDYGQPHLSRRFQAILPQLLKIMQKLLQDFKLQLDKKPEVKPEGGSEIKPEIRPEVRPEVKPEIRPEIKPEVIIEVRPEVIAEIAPEIKPEIGHYEIKPEVRPEIGHYEIKPEVIAEMVGVYNPPEEKSEIAIDIKAKEPKDD